MTCTCPASVTSRGVFSTRHAADCPARPAWCIGVDRPPHVTDTTRTRDDIGIPLCDACDLARRTDPKDDR